MLTKQTLLFKAEVTSKRPNFTLNVNYALQKFQKGKKKQLHESKYDFIGGHFSVFLLKVLTLNMQEKAKTTLRIKQQNQKSDRKM